MKKILSSIVLTIFALAVSATVSSALDDGNGNLNPTKGDILGGIAVSMDGPNPAPLTFTKIDGGGYHSIALSTNGHVYTWGWNSSGQLGNGTTTNSSTPVAVTMPTLPLGATIIQVAASWNNSYMLASDGTVYAWGANNWGQLGRGNTTTPGSSIPIAVVRGAIPTSVKITQIYTDQDEVLVLGDNGRVYGWGYNNAGQLGDGSTTTRNLPVEANIPAGVSITGIARGVGTGFAISTTGAVYAWGWGLSKQLGIDGTGNIATPTYISSLSVPSSTAVSTIDAGAWFTMGLTATGKVYTWGSNYYGTKGNGTADATGGTNPEAGGHSDPVAPNLPSGTIISKVAAGNGFALALSSTGKTLYAWGRDDSGQIGYGTTQTRVTSPVTVSLPAGVTISEIAAGWEHALALTSDGHLYTWGNNTSGQLGNNTTSDSTVPVGPITKAITINSVTFDGIAATNVSYDQTTHRVSVTNPAHAAGTVNVVINWSYGGVVQTPITYAQSFTYTKNLWLGNSNTSTGTNWNLAGNWTNNRVSTTGEDIEFATAANNNGNAAVNNLQLDQNRAIGNLINETNLATIIPPGKCLTVNGVITGSETVANAGKLQIQADSDNPNSSLILSCNNQSGTDVYATVQMYAKGYLGTVTTTLDDIAGSPTKGLPLTTDYAWQQFGVPVAATTNASAFSGSYVAQYSEPRNNTTNTRVGPHYATENPSGPAQAGMLYDKWIMQGSVASLSQFKGYIITQNAPRVITMQGKLVYCDQEITLTRQAARVPGAYSTDIEVNRWGLGQNVFGNSFTAAIPISAIDFENIKYNGANVTNEGDYVQRTVYLYNTGTFGGWQGETGNQPGGGSYSNATNAGQYKAIPVNTSSVMDYSSIPSMQGFLLMHKKAETGLDGAGYDITMTLPYSGLTRNVNPQTAPRAPLSYLEVRLNSQSTGDVLWLFSQQGTSDDYDDGWDGEKFFGTPTAFIYAKDNVTDRQVHTTDNLLGSYIYFRDNGDTDYTLTLKKSNLDAQYQTLYLLDLLDNTMTPLNDDVTTYSFTAAGEAATEQRFQIVGAELPVGNDDTEKVTYLDTYAMGNNIVMQNQTEFEGTMSVFDAVGRIIMTKRIAPYTTETYSGKLTPGVYLVRMTAGKYQRTVRVVLNPGLHR